MPSKNIKNIRYPVVALKYFMFSSVGRIDINLGFFAFGY